MNGKQAAHWGVRYMGVGAAIFCLFSLPDWSNPAVVLAMIGVVFFWIGFVKVGIILIDKYLE